MVGDERVGDEGVGKEGVWGVAMCVALEFDLIPHPKPGILLIWR